MSKTACIVKKASANAPVLLKQGGVGVPGHCNRERDLCITKAAFPQVNKVTLMAKVAFIFF